MVIPTRPAPSVPRSEPSRENFYHQKKPVGQVKPKKKPPPRPPPPKFNKKPDFTTSLIDLSAPLEDYLQAANANVQPFKPFANDDLFSTQNDFFKPTSNNNNNNDFFKPKINTDDLFKSKVTNNDDFFKRRPLASSSNNYAVGNSSFFGSTSVNHLDLAAGSSHIDPGPKTNVVAPTIIRAQPKTKRDHYGSIQVNEVNRGDLDANNYSPPMPTIPPPSPPKCIYDNQAFDDTIPHGIALYNYPATHKDDLPLQVNDVVILLRQINDEWLYGKVGDYEGMFPANFVDIRVPLIDMNDNIVTALYEFNPETREDLKLVPGQKIKVLKKICQSWLYGESNGYYGQFPANFVDRIPANL